VVSRDDERISHVLRWIIDQTHRGSLESYAIGVTSPGEGSIFYAEELAQVLLEQGRVRDFLRIFYTLLASDISHETLTTCEWKGNTQPHVHSISGLVHMLRTMLLQERDGALYLLQGMPRAWLEQGKEIVIRDAPTWYGPISLHCTSAVDEGRVTIALKVPEHIGHTPIRLRIRAPYGRRLAAATVEGQGTAKVEKDWIVLTGAGGEVSVEGTLQTDLERVKKLLESNAPVRWVFAGDSVTSGVLYTFGERDYVQLFEERLRWELQRDQHIVIKSAVSGWNTEALKKNIEWNVLKFDPDVVSIMMGMNDAGFVTVEQFKANTNVILDQIAERTNAAVILHTPNPLAPGLSNRDAAVAAVAQAVREIGAERGLPVVDQYAAYEQAWKENGRRVFVWMADGVHPGTIGHRVFAREMMKVLGIWDEKSETGKLIIY
jgi:acyl-CoA thioesterase-1